MVLVRKWSFFQLFSLGNIGQENVFYGILERKNVFLGNKNKNVKKSKNWHFSEGVNPWFWSENGHFSNFFFLGNIGHENVFYYILERKNAFLGYNNRKFKKSKNWTFSKLFPKSMVLVQNWPFFQLFFLGNIGQENVFFDILELKKAFLGYKKKEVQKGKKLNLSKGVDPWFSSINGHFSQFFFWGNIRQAKCFFTIFYNEKTFF